jgi:hypothetical protein
VAINLNHATNKIVSTDQDLVLDSNNANIGVSDKRIVKVQDPVDEQDAVNKRYLENQVSSQITNSTFLFTNANPMPEDVGGYEPGSTFDDATLQQLFQNLLYPYQYPAVTSFSIPGQATTLEVGDSVPGGLTTFNWDISNDVNVNTNSISIKDETSNTLYSVSLTNDNNESIDIGSAITKTSASSNTWRLSAQNTRGQSISRTFNVYWKWRTYYGTSPNTSLSENEVKSLVSTSLDSNFSGNKSVSSENYKYFAYPTSFGLKSTFQDAVNGFAVAMEPAETLSITNEFGISTDYYIHRTTNPIVGSLTVKVG